MYTEASLDNERCRFNAGTKAKNRWITAHAMQIRLFEDVNNPINII